MFTSQIYYSFLKKIEYTQFLSFLEIDLPWEYIVLNYLLEMAGLPHYTTSKASINKLEPIYMNLWEVNILLPTGVTAPQGVPSSGNILLEQVKSVQGLEPDINPGEVTQQFKNAKRYYAGAAPSKTGFDLRITFEVNLNENNSMYVFKCFRQWADLIYNPLTGAQGLKRDLTGIIIVSMFNKAGDVYRKVTCKDVFISAPLTSMELNYTGSNLYDLSASFAVDNFEDIFI